MAYELFTIDGKRKYLNADELDFFIAASGQQERSEVRTLCLGAGPYGLPDIRSLGTYG